MTDKFNLIVIGGGPGGYTAAIKAARLGLSVALVESRQLGGTCLNRGCVPTKAMLHTAALYRQIKYSECLGIAVDNLRFDYAQMLSYRQNVVQKLSAGVQQLLQANGVKLFQGHGRLMSGNRVSVDLVDGKCILQAEKVILAAGSRPKVLSLSGIDLPGVLNSDDLLALRELPQSLVIIGGGAVGVEFAEVFAALGTRVTIIEAASQLLPALDKEIAQNLKMILKKRGVDIHTNVEMQSIAQDADNLVCHYSEKDLFVDTAAQYVLCAVGREPNIEELWADDVLLQMKGNYIDVGADFATSLPGVYAIGDLLPGSQLAHAAMAQGLAVVEQIAGLQPAVDFSVIPACVYTEPQIASVGLTEAQAREKGLAFNVGKYVMHANAKSVIEGQERELIKVVAQADSGKILGAQIMCAGASDMIGEFVNAVANGWTAEYLIKGMRAHPTHSEGVYEALSVLV